MTAMPSLDLIRKAVDVPYVPPFQSGDEMDQPTFHALYETAPSGFRAELVGGIVYMPSPVSRPHAAPHGILSTWLGVYCSETDGTEFLPDATMIMSNDDEPQPDLSLIVSPDIGGQTSVSAKQYLVGAPELAIEVAHSTASTDLHSKKRSYERYGVRDYIVVVTKSQTVYWFTRRGAKFAALAADRYGIFKSRVFPGLWLDPSALFERSPKRLLATLRLGLATSEHARFAAKLQAKLAKAKR